MLYAIVIKSIQEKFPNIQWKHLQKIFTHLLFDKWIIPCKILPIFYDFFIKLTILRFRRFGGYSEEYGDLEQ